MGELVQQRRAVARIHLHDGEAVRRLVVHQHVGFDAEGVRAHPRRGFRLQPVAQFPPLHQRIADRRFQPRELALLGKHAAQRILHEEIVQRHAVARGVDARVDDVAARDVDGAGDAAEQARMVGGVDRDQRRPAIRIRVRLDRQWRLARARHEGGVARQHVGGLRDPIRFGQPANVGGERGRVPPHRGAQRLLLGGQPLGPPLLLVAQAQHFLAGLVQIGQ